MKGVHPEYFKETSRGKGPFAVSPKKVYIPLSQHTGKPAKSIVKKGNRVKKGQKIAQADGFISLPIHASVSGEVKDVKCWPHPSGNEILTIFIESDGTDELIKLPQHPDYWHLSPEEIVEFVKQAGIAGLGGAAFPTHVKISPPKDKDIDFILINGCECEPYLTCDDLLVRNFSHQIIEGIKIIMQTVDAHRAIICLEDNKPEAANVLKKELMHQPNIEISILKTKYPQGAEKQLIKAVTGREVPAGGLPFDVGAIVSNVGTAYAIRQAIIKGFSLIERMVTVTGKVKNPGNYWVPLGTSFGDLIEQAGGFLEEPRFLIAGGPMMGISQASLNVPVIKGTSGVLVLGHGDVQEKEETECIRCAKCVDSCPMNLVPTSLVKFVKGSLWDKLNDYFINDCMECGCCAYICPAKIPIVQYIKWGKYHLSRKSKIGS